MALHVVVEGHGEVDAIGNLLTRLISDLALTLPHLAAPARGLRIDRAEGLVRHARMLRAQRNVDALLVLRDDDDGCPRMDGPRDAAVLRDLRLPFPAAVVLAYREYESLFLRLN